MKGYPKVIATKKDFINLFAIPEFREKVLADLKAIHDFQDDTMEVVKSYAEDEKGQMVNVVTATIRALLPKWKRMGFSSKKDVQNLFSKYSSVEL